MRRTRLLTASLVLVVALCGACTSYEHHGSLTAPSGAAAASLVGNWASASALTFPTAQSCAGMTWKITSQNGNTVTGDFSASCAGGLTLQGTGTGTVNGSTIPWQATGTVNGPGFDSCSFTLSGTGYIGTETIQIDYSGTTCLGPVSGSETLQRH